MKNFLLKLRAKLSFAPVVILVEEGKARRVRGNVSNTLLHEFTLVAGKEGVEQGLITVTKSGGGPVLGFSGSLDDSAKQRFRNVWFATPQRRLTGV